MSLPNSSTQAQNVSEQSVSEHHLEWNDRLQDWLDGDPQAEDGAVFEKHLGECPLCQQRLEELQQLESALFAASPRPQLSADFDAKLFAQIDAADDARRAAARQRVEQELQQNLRALSRSWRRTLLFMIPGIVGGIVLALTVAGYFDAAGISARLAAQGASELGGNAGTIQTLITALLGAGIGGFTSRWLSRAAG